MHTPTIAEPLEVYEDTNPNDIENAAATEVNVEPTPIGTKIVVLLKFIGAGVVAAAMALFLLDGIQVNNDIQRFLTILGFGALLTASGLAVNHWLTDRVASRLFIGLSLAAVPVIASVLGGLIFSLTDAAKTMAYPSLATWTLTSVASLWMAVPLGIAVLAAISALGTMVMARAESRWMTPALLISSATLFIPTREASIIAVVAAAALVALFWMVKRYRVNPISFQTAEGRWALAVLFAAPLILIGRTALLYQIDAFAGFCFSVIVYALSYRVFKRSAAGSIIEIISFCFAVITLVATVTSLTYAVCDLLSALFPRTVDWYGYPVRRVYVESAMPGLWGSLLLFATHSFIAKRSPWKLSRAVNILATVAVAIVLSLHLLFDSGLSAALIINSALLGTCLVVNFKHSRYVEGVVVLLAFSVIFLINLSGLMDFAMNTGWWGLAVAGMLAIFSGALLERSLARPTAAA